MPELIALKTQDWTLHIWCNDIRKAQRLLEHTLTARHTAQPITQLRFDPPLYGVDEIGCDLSGESVSVSTVSNQAACSVLDLPQPLFFENTHYSFDFHWADHVTHPKIKHRLRIVEDAFHLIGQSLRGSLYTANHIGWFKLNLHYEVCGSVKQQAISFEVLPTKMDSANDLVAIHQTLDKQYPLLHFSFAQKTALEHLRSKKLYERFPLLWLAQFESLRQSLEQGIEIIMQQPHSRLLTTHKTRRAEQIIGRLQPKLEEKLGAAQSHHYQGKHYPVISKKLTLDTPENRFIKHVLIHCNRELTAFIQKAKKANQTPDKGRLSASFFTELDQWQQPLSKALKQPFFRQVGAYSGVQDASLVLQQQSGYVQVYRVWQQLKLYLAVLGRQASISMKSVAELYEVWCVLEVKRILQEELGFNEVKQGKAALYKKGFEKALREGVATAFHLQRGDMSIRLLHEPHFSLPKHKMLNDEGIYAWVTAQRPDILLEATYANGDIIRWVFDAKYRIAPDANDVDLVPDEAINQMHRYRDALIHIQHTEAGEIKKSRPIVGAFVLYPGWFAEEAGQNPYQAGIDDVGIGAYPLLPKANNSWLRDFFMQQLGDAASPLNGYDYGQSAVKIVPTGMTVSHEKASPNDEI